MRYTTDAQAEWQAYCALFNSGASRAELLKAARAMTGDNQSVALRNLGVTTASERREIAARWASINSVTDAEARLHCQFGGLPNLSRQQTTNQ